MGMAASQARYLQLTARRSDIEYQAQQITQARMTLSNSMEDLANVYNEKLSNKRLYFVPQSDTWNSNGNLPLLSYSAIVGDVTTGGMGMRLTDALGNIVVTAMPETLDEGKTKSDYIVDTDVNDPAYLDQALRNGQYFLSAPVLKDGNTDPVWQTTNWQTSPYIQDNLYTDDDAQATSEYESKLSVVQRQDKMLEIDLKNLDSERTAIETEMDSVKKVIDKATEVFKTFGSS